MEHKAVRWMRGTEVLRAAALVVIAPCGAAAQGSDSLARATERSSFVFEGTITARGVVNVPHLTPSQRTALVRVTQVLVGPTAWRQVLPGKVVTMLATGVAPAESTHGVFFTSGWVLGGGYAFREVYRVPWDSSADFVPRIAAEIDSAQKSRADNLLLVELKKAGSVVVARVDSVRKASTSSAAESDARWQDTWISVLSYLKGGAGPTAAAGSTHTRVYVPGSRRVPWTFIEKVKAPDVRVFLLMRARASRSVFPEIPPAVPYVVLDAEHIRPASDSTRVKVLLARP